MPNRLTLILSLILASACTDGTVVTGGTPRTQPVSSQVATVTVTPLTVLLTVGDTVRMRAATLDAGGAVLLGRVVTWSTESASVAAVSSDGLVTAVTPGSIRIGALSEGRAGQATVTIVAR